MPSPKSQFHAVIEPALGTVRSVNWMVAGMQAILIFASKSTDGEGNTTIKLVLVMELIPLAFLTTSVTVYVPGV